MKTKIKIFLLALSGILLNCKEAKPVNPIYNTAWAGVANIPTAQNIVLKFSGDDIDVMLKDKIVEQMKFKVSNDTLHIEKTMGGSPCPVKSKGVYRYIIEGDQLSLKYVSDECDSRQYNMTVSNFKKVAFED
ncbi:hypothetical protein [Kaistella jeonii]|uniref:Lipoprotein n=1 Tax=Kaistella jeonii TaxID=266749 RepID=A0A0C1D379_9FLAO|nr:hypothetical protein [Kaistella jeonii]KIA88255.1 hypothetical protein OA86_12115 [Kaistella jeonii]SFC27105.1 hypothetical protein SAMN05421876_11182 [Kaistella jeonii]VEI95725.1 Uncharacterised protein [Kaistella jeonii]